RRMGQDKARLRLGRQTMLSQVKTAARATGVPVRVIRRDAVPRCGPLGGIYTALQTNSAQSVLFLACDMPFVTTEFLCWLLGHHYPKPDRRIAGQNGFFVRSKGSVGFPFVLPLSAGAMVATQIKNEHFSIRKLAEVLESRIFRVP